MIYHKEYDVIVIGGGHAGSEAAAASARMGLKTLLLTYNVDQLGQLSCNPAIGGIGKGHLVKEIDAMGGMMGKAADACGIQFRILNSSKGPAVRATRAQIDRHSYRLFVREYLFGLKNLDIFQQEVVDIKLNNDTVEAVITKVGIEFKTKTAILTTGTFLGGKIHVGMEHYTGGRAGDAASISLADRLRSLNLRVGRLKTGTPPRIDAKTIDFSKLGVQFGDGVGQRVDGQEPHLALYNQGIMPLPSDPTYEATHVACQQQRQASSNVDKQAEVTLTRSQQASLTGKANACNFAGDAVADYAARYYPTSDAPVFSFLGTAADHPLQVPSYMTYTNEETHTAIRANLDRSPMYAGVIEGVGPRYCPSIEDKVVRFANKDRHQIFLEPEGLDYKEIYPNGVSTSLPFDVQVKLINSMPGLENALIVRPGYAIEYDYYDPRDLKLSLESKNINNLFFAGQINGTTGYEEAAAQGLLAGINAGLRAQGKDAWYPTRSQAYLGVLIDDLCTLGTNEPYRLFTSRAEYRLLLREDNSDLRLTPIAHELGLIDEQRWSFFTKKQALIEAETTRLASIYIHPSVENITAINSLLQAPLTKEASGLDMLKRPDMDYQKLMQIQQFANGGIQLTHDSHNGEEVVNALDLSLRRQAAQQVEINAKYQGYIDRQLEEIAKLERNEQTEIPPNFSYDHISGLSNEVIQKLNNFRPATIGQASRISGITPAAISILLVYVKKFNQANGSTLPGGIPRTSN